MKWLPNFTKEIFDNLPKTIKTDKDLYKYFGIKLIEIEDDIGFHYGYYKKETKTSLYLISLYEKDPNIYLDKNSLESLKSWMENDWKESGLVNESWKKACK